MVGGLTVRACRSRSLLSIWSVVSESGSRRSVPASRSNSNICDASLRSLDRMRISESKYICMIIHTQTGHPQQRPRDPLQQGERASSV